MAVIGFPGIPGCGHFECDICKMPTERVFTDSYTGKDMCLDCAHVAAFHTTSSPVEEGDNLMDVMAEHVYDQL